MLLTRTVVIRYGELCFGVIEVDSLEHVLTAFQVSDAGSGDGVFPIEDKTEFSSVAVCLLCSVEASMEVFNVDICEPTSMRNATRCEFESRNAERMWTRLLPMRSSWTPCFCSVVRTSSPMELFGISSCCGVDEPEVGWEPPRTRPLAPLEP